MSISYSGLRTKAKATLPSVEMWGTNMNILKDPPKSIHTRRIDKVGQTQSVLLTQDESGDRVSECLQVYGRGINPMVAVSFDNYSNNGGRGSPFQHTQAVSLPYKVKTFRPPILRQEDLLPLSRLPRNWFYSYTNPSFPGVVQAAQCNETGKSVHDTILHPTATANKTVPAVGNVPRDAPQRTVLSSIPHMSTETNLSLPHQTYVSDEYDTGAEKKSIVADKRDVVAITNKTVDFSPQQADFSSLGPGKLGDAFHIQVGAQKSFMKNDQHANFITKDPKQINWNKYLCIAKTNRATKENYVSPYQETDTSKVAVKDYLYSNVKSQATSIFQMPQHPEKNPTKSLVQNPLHMNVEGTKQLKGGVQPTENSVSTISTKPYLYQDVQTQKTSFLTMNNEENNRVMTHSIQEDPLAPSAQTTRSFIASKNAVENGVFEIHNQKRTPLHSIQTNTQTPYSMPLLPETVLEQKRSHPLMETSTAQFDAAQIEATRNAYQIQSRNGSHRTQPMLPKGGFEGQGSAVPVFNQYENYQYSISDPARQELRQRTVSIMEGRYDQAPVFS